MSGNSANLGSVRKCTKRRIILGPKPNMLLEEGKSGQRLPRGSAFMTLRRDKDMVEIWLWLHRAWRPLRC